MSSCQCSWVAMWCSGWLALLPGDGLPAGGVERGRRTVFASVAHLLDLDLDIVLVDTTSTTSTYWEGQGPDLLAEPAGDDAVNRPAEQAKRTFGHSKDFRDGLPQVVIAMAVTRHGVAVRCWTFPGNTADTAIIRTVKDDLTGLNLRRMIWVADRGFASAANRAY